MFTDLHCPDCGLKLREIRADTVVRQLQCKDGHVWNWHTDGTTQVLTAYWRVR